MAANAFVGGDYLNDLGKFDYGIISPITQRGKAATKMISLAQNNELSRNPPSPPFSKGGLGGFQRIVAQRKFAYQNLKRLQVSITEEVKHAFRIYSKSIKESGL